jgi:peptide deformylase
MKKVEILTLPSPILRKKAKKIDKIDKKTEATIKKMIRALKASEIEGLAIAAPQIGESIRLIVVRVREQRDKDGKIIQKEIPLTAYINPEITKFSKEKCVLEEGCLSCPNYYGPVERPAKIKFEATTIEGKKIKRSTAGILAKIIQHEVDHLDGILFIDRVTDKSKLRKVELKDGKRPEKQS